MLAAFRVIFTSDQNGPLCDLFLLAFFLDVQIPSDEFREDAGDTLVEAQEKSLEKILEKRGLHFSLG